MKRILLALLLAAPVQADDEVCTTMGNMAAAIMESRLNGGSLSEDMAKWRALLSEEADSWVPMALRMTREAYERPAYTGEEYKARAILRFRNKAELDCYKMFDEG